MIPVKITRPVYIRKGPGRSHDILGVAQPSGKTIFMDGVVDGEVYKGISKHYYTLNEKGEKQYSWSGRFEEQVCNYNNLIQDIPKEWRETKGKNTKVVILDTGISGTHRDLKINSLNYFNFCSGTSNKFDEAGHGTKVAGIIGGDASIQSTMGICGIAPSCEIISYKISIDGAPDPTAIQNTKSFLIDLAKNNNAIIVNCSWDTPQSIELDDMFTTSPENLIYICAAGNNSDLLASEDFLLYPASLKRMISVGYIREDLFPSIISSGTLNQSLDFIYVGNAIESCSVPNSDSYSDFDKCSMSTAIMSGIVSLLLSSLSMENLVNSEIIRSKLKSQLPLLPQKILDNNFRLYKLNN